MKELLDLSAQMGHKDKGLKWFVPEEQARMCDEREKEGFERQTDKDRVFQLQFCQKKSAAKKELEERQHQ